MDPGEHGLALGGQRQHRAAPVPLIGHPADQAGVHGRSGEPAGPGLVHVQQRGYVGDPQMLVGQRIQKLDHRIGKRARWPGRLLGAQRQAGEGPSLLRAPQGDDRGLDGGDLRVLATLAQGSQPGTALSPFRDADDPGFHRELAGLRDRGWVADDEGTAKLTDEGKAAHTGLAARVAAARSVVTQGLTPDQYDETVRLLAVMAGNVEAALAQR